MSDSLERELLADQDLEDTKAALKRTLRALDQEKRSKAELVEAVYRAARDAASAHHPAPAVPLAPTDTRRTDPEVAVAILGDWQLGKITPSYNSEVCEQRVALYADELLKTVADRRHIHPVKELRVWLLGDIVEGELIFPGQSHKIDASLYRQVFHGGAILRDFLRRMAGAFPRVEVVGIIGNHGAVGGSNRREMNPETNADRFLYRHVAEVLEGRGRKGGEPAKWTIPEGEGESNWYAIDAIGAYRSLLFHGYNLKGHAGFPWYGLGKKVGGWSLGAIEDFVVGLGVGDLDVDFGHWHQPTRVTLNRVTARCNGSTESHNTFAQEQLAAVGRPSQGLRFIDPVRGRVTAEHTISLD